MRNYYFVIAEKKASGIEYLGVYDNEHKARETFLDFSKEYGREECDERYSIIVFIDELNGEQQGVFEEKPSKMKWYHVGDKK